MIEKEQFPDKPNPPGEDKKDSNISKQKQEIEKKSNEQLKENSEEQIKNKNNMETYHPHKMHQGRKFKDYFLEFIMLFIAITAGFFMENLREYYVERHKEKQFIGSMIKDIQEDTTSMQSIMESNKKQIKGIDSLLNILEKPHTEINIKEFYKYTFFYLNSYTGFTIRDITITQLKNSGGFRLIESKPVSDSIILYYSMFDSYKEQLVYNIKTFQDMIALEMDFMDFGFNRNTNKKLTLKNTDRLYEFYNHVIISYYAIVVDNNWLVEFKKRGASLLSFLKKEYDIKN